MPPSAAPALDKQSLCLDILVSGHVQAYVDFFYLTHRPDIDHEDEPEEPEPADDQVGIPSNMLPHVKTQLEEAEVARRRGDTQAVFASYRQLADFFTGLEDQRTAIYFWEKCLEITQLTSDVDGEKQATRSLGMAHEASKDMTAAIKQYETLLDLATGTSDVAGTQQASEHLVVAYEASAVSADSAGDSRGALECREKCLDAARASGDPAKESKAQYDLGQAHEKLGELEHLKRAVSARAALGHDQEATSFPWPGRFQATSPETYRPRTAATSMTAFRNGLSQVMHYEQHLSLAEKAAPPDVDAQGAASYALAQVYQRMQHGEASLRYLQKFLSLAQSSCSVKAQAEACCSLGVLYNTQVVQVSNSQSRSPRPHTQLSPPTTCRLITHRQCSTWSASSSWRARRATGPLSTRYASKPTIPRLARFHRHDSPPPPPVSPRLDLPMLAPLTQARTYLGIARGNSVLPAYTKVGPTFLTAGRPLPPPAPPDLALCSHNSQVVTNDLEGLLRWKNRRTPFTDQLVT